ncbi:enoyl-CoA hydratase [Nocardia camponoti]|uniref:Enoyl-CoA hydratase n=1 Tax=Nocardia camponoti TaxID=1616106 RepID=A0A917Q7D6_9NOCA|nr:enoyl-CoA hydratase [Nocardia camponoti]GGK32989.1 enoyl-CoA hydratase [Nocardia camponoti]
MSLDIERRDGVLRLCINRPDRLNALDHTAMNALTDAIIGAPTDPSLRAIVITGAGPAFCTGADLAAMSTADTAIPPQLVMSTAARGIRAIIDSPLPVIAQVNGVAAGVGASLALIADLIYAAESAYFLLPFTGIGLMPDGGSTAVAAASVGRTRAMEMSLLGKRITATEAQATGLVTACVPDAELSAAVDAAASRIVARPRRALELTKRAINDATLGELDNALERESVGQSELLIGADFAEGMSAMLQHRKPRFS